MIQQKEILAAFLQSKLHEHELQLDEKTISLINSSVHLIDRPGEEKEETRAITVEQDSSGKRSATSFKLYNISQISIYDLLGFIGKEAGIALFDDTAQKVIYSLIMLLHEFYPQLKVSFKEQEANVLFAISRMEKKQFTIAELENTFEGVFNDKLPEKRMEASLEVLVKHRVLKRTAVKEYFLREKIKNLTREDD